MKAVKNTQLLEMILKNQSARPVKKQKSFLFGSFLQNLLKRNASGKSHPSLRFLIPAQGRNANKSAKAAGISVVEAKQTVKMKITSLNEFARQLSGVKMDMQEASEAYQGKVNKAKLKENPISAFVNPGQPHETKGTQIASKKTASKNIVQTAKQTETVKIPSNAREALIQALFLLQHQALKPEALLNINKQLSGVKLQVVETGAKSRLNILISDPKQMKSIEKFASKLENNAQRKHLKIADMRVLSLNKKSLNNKPLSDGSTNVNVKSKESTSNHSDINASEKANSKQLAAAKLTNKQQTGKKSVPMNSGRQQSALNVPGKSSVPSEALQSSRAEVSKSNTESAGRLSEKGAEKANLTNPQRAAKRMMLNSSGKSQSTTNVPKTKSNTPGEAVQTAQKNVSKTITAHRGHSSGEPARDTKVRQTAHLDAKEIRKPSTRINVKENTPNPKSGTPIETVSGGQKESSPNVGIRTVLATAVSMKQQSSNTKQNSKRNLTEKIKPTAQKAIHKVERQIENGRIRVQQDETEYRPNVKKFKTVADQHIEKIVSENSKPEETKGKSEAVSQNLHPKSAEKPETTFIRHFDTPPQALKTETLPPKWQPLVSRINELIDKFSALQKNRMVKTSFKIDQSPSGKMEIHFEDQGSVKTIKILVESDATKNEMQKFAPQIQQNLNTKGIEFVNFIVQVGQFGTKSGQATHQQRQTHKHKNKETKEVRHGDEQSPVKQRNYGYNTIEVVV